MVFGLLRYQNRDNEALLNEINKIFRDRLVSQDQQMKFDGLMQSLFKVKQDSYYGTAVNLSTLSKLDKKDFKQLVQQGITLYSREHKEI